MTPAFLAALLDAGPGRAGGILDVRLPAGFPDLEERGFLQGRLRKMAEDPAAAEWVAPRLMVLRASREAVGNLGFHLAPDAGGQVEIGYSVFPAHRGRGYTVEAASLLIDWAVRERGVTRFRASVSPANAPSLAVVRRLGFHQTGSRVDEVDGEELVFEMVRVT